MSDPHEELDIREQLTRIDQALAESHKLAAEESKLRAETFKLYTEERKLDRERVWFPWLQLVIAVTANTMLTTALAAAVALVVVKLVK
jgi:hypothetical protein